MARYAFDLDAGLAPAGALRYIQEAPAGANVIEESATVVEENLSLRQRLQ